MARPLAVVLSLGLGLGACVDTDVSTSPYAHESPPLPPPPLQNLVRSAFLGGSGTDVIDDFALGADGTIYVVGGTDSANFPTTDGSTLDTTAAAGCSACPFDAFVAAIGPDGHPRWVRLISSPGYDRLTSIELVGQTLYVAGSTGQRGALAGWHGGADPSGERGEQDGLVCAVSATDGTLGACRYLGGNGPGGVADLAARVGLSNTTLGAIMITTATENLHLDAGYSAAFAGRHRATSAGADVALFSLTSDLAATDNLRWATYLGGTGDERGTPSVIFEGDGVGTLGWWVLAETTSPDAPVPGGFDTTLPADGDSGYLTKVSDEGDAVLSGTYVGGNGADRVTPHGITDAFSTTVIGLTTTSTDMPITAGVPQPTYGGNGGPGCGDGDVWLATLVENSGTGLLTLLRASYLGGTAGERLGGISFGFGTSEPVVMVTGHTFSPNFPSIHAAQPGLTGPFCTTNPGNADVFVSVLDFDLVRRDSTFLGGSAFERSVALAISNSGRTVVVGDTGSSNFPTLGPGDLGANGGTDGFIAEYGLLPAVPPTDGGAGMDASLDGDVLPPTDSGTPFGDDAGGAYHEDGAGCVCSTGGGATPTAGLGLAGLVLALVTRRRRR